MQKGVKVEGNVQSERMEAKGGKIFREIKVPNHILDTTLLADPCAPREQKRVLSRM
jgi:hypothetical protein